MQSSIINSEYAKTTIRCKARQLVGKAGFTSSDIEDIEQTLRTHLLQRLPSYDPAKAAPNTFVARMVDRKVKNMIRDRNNPKRDYHRESCSIHEVISDSSGESTYLYETMDEAVIAGRDRSPEESLDMSEDVLFVISTLPEDLRRIAEAVLAGTVRDAAKNLGISRTTLYKALRKMRPYFKHGDLDKYIQ